MVYVLNRLRYNDGSLAAAYGVVVVLKVLHVKPHVGVLVVSPVYGEYGLCNNFQSVVASCVVVSAGVKALAVVFYGDYCLFGVVLRDVDGESFLTIPQFKSGLERVFHE